MVPDARSTGATPASAHPAFRAACSMAENAEAVRLATDAAAQYVPEGEVASPRPVPRWRPAMTRGGQPDRMVTKYDIRGRTKRRIVRELTEHRDLFEHLDRRGHRDDHPDPSGTALPRIVVAAPGAGHGKTTIATGIMAALRERGIEVAGFKIGPDFTDASRHALATGRPGRNLDPFLCGEQRVEPLLLHGSLVPGSTGHPAEAAVIEGTMGLFDGRIGTDGFASTAHVATLTNTPVVVTLDVSRMTRTAAALVHGLATFDPRLRVAGVVLNKASSGRHMREVWSAVEAAGVPVLGVLPHDANLEEWPSGDTHRGAGDTRDAADAGGQDALARLAEAVATHVDLETLLAIAGSAPGLTCAPWNPAAELGGLAAEAAEAVDTGDDVDDLTDAPVVAVAAGPAFEYRYAETDELLRAAGLDPVPFDPLEDSDLPPGTAGLYLGGGFPERHSEALAANARLRRHVRDAVKGGLPTVAEGAGTLYLCEAIDGDRMVGVLPAVASTGSRITREYRTVVAPADTLLAAAGTRVDGHELHRTTASPDTAPGHGAWLLEGQAEGYSLDPAGTGRPTVHASHLHTHWAGHPSLAGRFVEGVLAYASAAADREPDAAARH
jgi:cobyrinic acid a,c-diamide synthase